MTAFDPLRTLAGRGTMRAMRVTSITANHHIFDGQVNGKPLRLLLTFDSDRALRLHVAADGAGLIADVGPLDAPSDLGQYGQTDIADVTQSLFPKLRGLEVTGVDALALNGRRVGARLSVAGGEAFHFWVDGDELHWGDNGAFVSHGWLDGVAPTASERIQV